ncbi:MAG: aminotransferase class III-fold pyridoxal phosphate-dependent enzyme [bacterium]
MKKKLIGRAAKVLSPVLGKYFPEFEIERAKGCYLYGTDGQKYLDFSSGIAVCATGHAHPKLVKAISDQAEKLVHICIGIACYEPYVELAEKLSQIIPIKKAQTFLCQSGTEAIEGAIKLAKYVTKKPGLVAIRGCFHGRTLGALSLTTSKMKYREGYEPLLPNVHIAEQNLNDVEAKLKNNDIAGLIVEPILGEGGYQMLPDGFLKGLRRLCTQYNVLLIIDEIQTGMGRTGKWLAIEHFGVTPDIVCLSKGIASGLPLGAVVASAEIMKNWSPGSHGGTFGGNPVCCAAANATIDIIKIEKLLAKANKLGAYLKSKLKGLQKEFPIVKDVRGLGLLIGVDFGDAARVKKITDHCLANNLVIIPTGGGSTVIRFIPPLIVTKKEIDQALKIFKQALKHA